jgi:hypothetical protein
MLPGGTREPFDIFSLLFVPELILIVGATNSYALRNHKDLKYPWKPLSLPELYVWIGCVVYMGVHPEPHIDLYWKTQSDARGPTHAIREVIGSTRFHQIRRNLTIVDRGEGTHVSELWYAPLEPLIYHLREAFRAYFLPGTSVSIDEAMAKCEGAPMTLP